MQPSVGLEFVTSVPFVVGQVVNIQQDNGCTVAFIPLGWDTAANRNTGSHQKQEAKMVVSSANRPRRQGPRLPNTGNRNLSHVPNKRSLEIQMEPIIDF